MRSFCRGMLSIIFLFSITAHAYAAELSIQTEVIIFHAGSLSNVLQKMADAFTAIHPEIKITLEGSGSREAARKVTELQRPCDIVASADYETIDSLMIPEYAKFNILFARNKTVIGFTDKSKYADEINAGNWYEILAKPEVRYGHTDPNLDPGGYRALLTLQLAEKFYQQPGLYEKLTANFAADNMINNGKDIAEHFAKGQLDYFFLYESSAKQAGYRYITLPEQIDFSSLQYSDYYQQASINLTGKTPGSSILVKGQPIIYGLTMVQNAPHPRESLLFLKFLLTNGQAFFKDAGFMPMSHPLVRLSELSAVPVELKSIIETLGGDKI